MVLPRRGKHGKEVPQIALGSPLAREALPAPIVYYPNRHGIFFAFAASRDLLPSLCACAEGAVRNLLRLASGRLSPEDFGFFPDVVARTFLGQADPMGALRFRRGLCHRCNLVPPTLRYCHEAEGQRFVQTYGWYINQTYLRLGIHPATYRYLPEVCPPEYHDVLNRIAALTRQAREARAVSIARMNDPRGEIAAAGAPLEEIEYQLSRPRRELGNAIQNAVRAEFGVRAIGDGWVCETQLYRLVCELFPGEEVLRRHRPEWLEGLELDIYLPGRRLGIEYQGQQHFHPVKAWGGEEALRDLQARDARKAEICRAAGVHLVAIDFTEPLTAEHIRERTTPTADWATGVAPGTPRA